MCFKTKIWDLREVTPFLRSCHNYRDRYFNNLVYYIVYLLLTSLVAYLFCVTDGVHLQSYFRATCICTVCSLHLFIGSRVSYTTRILTYTVSILKDADLYH